MPIVDISIGTDIVETERIAAMIKKFGDAFLSKIFTGDEIAYCKRTANPPMGFAARFAAKEAFAKALGTGIGKNLCWKDVAIGKKSSGEPYLVLSKSVEAAMGNFGFSEAKVSISHTKTLAQAVVVLIECGNV
ncbi:MAG: holo-ACP synthase [Puniceicoccales bacterium]|jgi:holo-[acyl-carrier protein] synthase|nr:holo-ACP synthase [Puniceicoccales bacterium]